MASGLRLASIVADGRGIIDFARRHPERTVPQYPTWTLCELMLHVAGVHGRTAAICRELPQERIPSPEPAPTQDPFEWAEEMLSQMLEELRRADHEVTVWTFGSDPRLAFWERRMVIETGVHRWDAQGAMETPEPLPPLVATDGLDEFPDTYLGRLGDLPTIELVATDVGRSWRYGMGAPTATIHGPASSHFLRLMSRPGTPLPSEWEAAVDALGSPAKT